MPLYLLCFQAPGWILPLKFFRGKNNLMVCQVLQWKQIFKHFGKIDIVINNAGNMIMRMIEEFNEDEVEVKWRRTSHGAVLFYQALRAIP